MSFGTKTCFAEPKGLADSSLRRPLEETNPPPATTASVASTVLDVVTLMRSTGSPAVLLCDPQDGALRGIFTERDLLRIAHRDPDFVWMPIQRYMTPNPITLGPWDSIGFALNRMTNEGFRQIPLVDTDGRVCGVVSRAHLLRHLQRHLKSRRTTNETRFQKNGASELLKTAS
ncbi:MAG: CBS domain-containing protein [Planctomycetota bacterium]|nr:CBS domain-containing protein [Planctomycetota bacterium]